MTRLQCAYLHANGDVEGMAATFLSSKGLRALMVRHIRAEVESRGLPFSESRIKWDGDGLTAEQMATIKDDWAALSR